MMKSRTLRLSWILMGIGILFCAQQVQARYSGFWRNSFENRSSWLELQTDQTFGTMALPRLKQSLAMASGSLMGAEIATTFQGEIFDQFNQLVGTIVLVESVPSAPEIIDVIRTASGPKVYFRSPPENNPFPFLSFSLFYFTDPSRAPRLVQAYATQIPIIDSQPPLSGTGFYVMTATNSGRRNPAGTPDPWWSLHLTGDTSDSLWQEMVFKKRMGITSDYSAPFVYHAQPLPDTGGIDAVAVQPSSGDIFASLPATMEILRLENRGDSLGDPVPYRNTGFIAPGHRGLAIDPAGRLFVDNAASDPQYGGRIFRFDPADGKLFVGAINYFSQALGYANPVSAGPMVMGEDANLYVYDAISREVKQIPVNADYDANRRVGHGYYRYDPGDAATVLDLESKQDFAFALSGLVSTSYLYILDSNTIRGLPYGLPAMVTGYSYDTISLY